jgi:hypothetical protein
MSQQRARRQWHRQMPRGHRRSIGEANGVAKAGIR